MGLIILTASKIFAVVALVFYVVVALVLVANFTYDALYSLYKNIRN